MKYSNFSSVAGLLAKNSILQFFVEKSQKLTSNFLFNLRFSIERIKFSIYFARDFTYFDFV